MKVLPPPARHTERLWSRTPRPTSSAFATRRSGSRRTRSWDRCRCSVRHGESWAIVGPNGSGKSTLLDLAGGIRHPTSGVVELFGGRLGYGRRPRDPSADRVRRTSRRRGHPRALRGARRGADRQALHARSVDADVRRGRPPASPTICSDACGCADLARTPARDVQPGRTPAGVAGPGAVRTPGAPAARRAGGRAGSARSRAAARGVVLHRRCVPDDHARHPPRGGDTQDRDPRGAPATRPPRRLRPDRRTC